MNERDLNPKPMRVARILALKPLCESSILLVIKVKFIAQIDTFESIEQTYTSRVAIGVMDVPLQRLFYIIFANTSNSAIEPAKHQHVATTSRPTFETNHIKGTNNHCIHLLAHHSDPSTLYIKDRYQNVFKI